MGKRKERIQNPEPFDPYGSDPGKMKKLSKAPKRHQQEEQFIAPKLSSKIMKQALIQQKEEEKEEAPENNAANLFEEVPDVKEDGGDDIDDFAGFSETQSQFAEYDRRMGKRKERIQNPKPFDPYGSDPGKMKKLSKAPKRHQQEEQFIAPKLSSKIMKQALIQQKEEEKEEAPENNAANLFEEVPDVKEDGGDDIDDFAGFSETQSQFAEYDRRMGKRKERIQNPKPFDPYGSDPRKMKKLSKAPKRHQQEEQFIAPKLSSKIMKQALIQQKEEEKEEAPENNAANLFEEVPDVKEDGGDDIDDFAGFSETQSQFAEYDRRMGKRKERIQNPEPFDPYGSDPGKMKKLSKAPKRHQQEEQFIAPKLSSKIMKQALIQQKEEEKEESPAYS